VVPTGGIIRLGIGWIDGGTIWHIVGGQIGGGSNVLPQIGCISPFTHRQTQAERPLLGRETTRLQALPPPHQYGEA
jgi:hypothetical protein